MTEQRTYEEVKEFALHYAKNKITMNLRSIKELTTDDIKELYDKLDLCDDYSWEQFSKLDIYHQRHLAKLFKLLYDGYVTVQNSGIDPEIRYVLMNRSIAQISFRKRKFEVIEHMVSFDHILLQPIDAGVWYWSEPTFLLG